MKSNHISLIMTSLIFTILIEGCTSSDKIARKSQSNISPATISKLVIGSTQRNEVIATLGEPDYIRNVGKDNRFLECLIYSSTTSSLAISSVEGAGVTNWSTTTPVGTFAGVAGIDKVHPRGTKLTLYFSEEGVLTEYECEYK